MACRIITLVTIALAAALSTTAPVRAVELGSWEYKVRLKPDGYDGANGVETLLQTWTSEVVPIIEGALGKQAPKKVREGAFERGRPRDVIYYDTKTCTLSNAKLILRLRDKKNDDTLTAKYRASERAAAELITFADGIDRKKVEADIIPGKTGAPPFITQYSASGNLEITDGWRPKTVADIGRIIDLKKGPVQLSADAAVKELGTGIRITEMDLDKLRLSLSEKDEIEFSMAHWQAPDGANGRKTVVVEISFKYEGKEPLSGEAAQRADAIFGGLAKLRDADPELPPKTSFGLPNGCGGPE
jgi:hypothetical protein